LKKCIPIIISILLLLPVAACQSQTSVNGTPVEGNKVGNLANNFTLRTLDGSSSVTLSTLLGQPVMITFWSTT
jgi:hypothetical protein